MEQVYKYVTKRNVDFIFYKGDICVQCFDKPNSVYNETSGFIIDLAFMDRHGGWKKYLKRDKNKVNTKETSYYVIRTAELKMKKKELEKDIKYLEDEVKENKKKLYRINQLIF